MVNAINSYLKNSGQFGKEFSEFYWVGIPGCTTGSWSRAIAKIPPNGYDYLPVFTNKTVYESYYNGFCNSVIWPLFHYFPSHAEYSPDSFDNYIKANHEFSEVLKRYIRPNDVIWIHDYHLMPLAEMIRKDFPSITIGFFLHLPFPSFEIIRLLPRKWQEIIIKGMLGADLVGFHTIDYAAHFLQSVQTILGLDNEMHNFLYDDRLIKVDVFPISIDYNSFNGAFDDELISMSRASLRLKFPEKKIIFSISKLDYTSGVQNRLKAYEHFLMHNPGYFDKVIFILVVEPFRDSNKNAERKKLIDETVSNINSKYGNIKWQPLIYQYCTLDLNEIMTLYTACDIALITPLRDGMNLTSKEFIASRKDKKGVLILSEMAGAARELTDALVVNPNDISEMSDHIHRALEMTDEEQTQRMENMQSRIEQYNNKEWADDFIQQLDGIKKRQLKFQVRFIEESVKRNIFDNYRQSKKRLLLLDYDGTLVSFSPLPVDAKPDPHLIDLLKNFCDKPENEVFVISGRDSRSLEKWIGHLNINIISEHGARIKRKEKGWETHVSSSYDWKPEVKEIMESYVKRCANSFTEEKDFSMVWHYRNANPEQGKLRSLELMAELTEYTHNLGLQVMMGNKIVEVRNQGVDKGKAVKEILKNKNYDFILAAGDDRTDEDMFKELADMSQACTIKIGAEASYATYNLHTSQMMISMLDAMSNLH
jgi:trehalose 6-phosphate synthase/phosphatase